MNQARWVLLSSATAAGLIAGVAGGMIGARLSWPGGEAPVRAYLMAHPEVLPEAMRRLQDRETERRIAADRATIERPFGRAWAGDPKGDVTLVMFSDYACGFCRQSAPDIDRLLAADKRLKVVWREIPVLGPDSVAAARAALAVAQRGDYSAFHRAMFAGGRPDAAAIARAAHVVGLSPSALSGGTEIEREMEANLEMAGRLGITGTPSFVIGSRLLSGAVGHDALAAAIKAARADRG